MAVASADPVVIRPQPGAQEAYLASPADVAIYGGAAGGGKTWALLLEPLRHLENGDFGAVIFRRTYPQITNEGGMWDEAAKLYPDFGAELIDGDTEVRFPGGARVKFAHMQHEKDKFSWKGAQIPLIGFDQLEDFTEGQFWYLLSRNRSMCGVRPYVRATCNPVPDDDEVGGWLHRLISWWLDEDTGLPIRKRAGVLRHFVRVGEELHWADRPEALTKAFPGSLPKSLTFIPARLEDNPALEAVDPGYRAWLMALPYVERERLLGGNWKVRPSAGKVFNRAWFKIVKAAPVRGQRVRYWDKAGTQDGGKWTAGVRMSQASDGLWYLEDVIRGQWSALQREQVIRQTAQADGVGVAVWVEQEPGSGGKESAENTIRNLAGWTVKAERVTGDKVERAGPLAAQAEAGNVRLVEAPWNEAFLKEAHAFEPDAAFSDQIDAAAGAFNKLAGAVRTIRTASFSYPST